jgi:hypothetical protein
MTGPDPNNQSTVALLGGLIGDAKTLAIAHIDGVQLEIREELRDLKISIVYIVAAAAAFVVGGLLAALSIAEAVWLYTRLPTWAAYGVSASLFLAAGFVLVIVRARGPNDVDLVPDDGLQNIQDDAKWMANRVRDAAT